MYTVYKITCLVNGKVYVGATEKSAEERFKAHWYARRNPQCQHRSIYQDMNSFGRDAFIVETVESGLPSDEAAFREDYWIDKLRSDGYTLYNELGGGGSIQLTEDRKEEIIRMYKEGLGTKKIAKLVKRDRKTVRRILCRKEVKTRFPSKSIFSKEVLCIDTGVIYHSIGEAAKKLGLNPGNIFSCCSGKYKQTGGLHFRYV